MCLQAVHPGQARLSAGNALSCLPSARWNGKNAAKYETETRVVAQDKDNRSAAKSWPLYTAIGHSGEKFPSDKDNRAFYFDFRGTIFRMVKTVLIAAGETSSRSNVA